MSDPGRNAAGVSTAYVKAPRPASEDPISDDPPPYSACVPYPPMIYSNYPETHSSLPDNPPVYPGNEIPNRGIQTGNNLHEGRPSAPFLDVPSTSENPPGVHEPRVTPYNGQPECKLSFMAIRRNPLIYTGPSPKNRLVRLCTAIVVSIVLSTLVIAGTRSHFNKTRKTDYQDISDIYEDMKIKPVYKDDSHGTFAFGDRTKMNVLDFDKMRRAMKERVRTILNCVSRGKKNETYSDNVGDNVGDFAVESREADVDPNQDHVSNCIFKKFGKEEDDDGSSEPNFELKYPNFPDVLNARSSKFRNQRDDDDSRDMNFKRIADRFEDILGIPRKEKTNKNIVRKPASDHD